MSSWQLFPFVVVFYSLGISSSLATDWTYEGCYKDGENRLLDGREYKNDDLMTIERCAKKCLGFKYFGVQYGKECFCGNNAVKYDKVAEDKCDKRCSGDRTQTCGGTWKISVFKYTKLWTYKGCYKDDKDRLLDGREFKNDPEMTIGRCSRKCVGFKYFGVEYGKECFCGNEATKYAKMPEYKCDKQCSGNHNQKCGGTWFMNLYEFNGEFGDVSVPTPPAESEDSKYLGCYKDENDRILSSKEFKNDRKMTKEKCKALCKGYRFFGLEYSKECFCGNALKGYDKVEERKCDKKCAGNYQQTCGGTWHISVYQNTKEWTYQGCYKDNEDRILSARKEKSDKMTPEMCFTICKGSVFAGTENSNECFCGDEMKPSEKVEQTKCNMNCAGNDGQHCGGNWYIGVYKYNFISEFIELDCLRKPHTVYKNGCHCKKGYYGSPEAGCSEKCHCNVRGDPHIKTFDGPVHHYQGACTYLLAQTLPLLTNQTDPCRLRVESKFEHRHGRQHVSFTKSATIFFQEYEIKLLKNHKVTLDQESISAPFKTMDGSIGIDYNGKEVIVDFNECGHSVKFDGNADLSVYIDASYKNKIYGLCGNCDGVHNEYKTFDGIDVSGDEYRDSKIGDSYRVSDDPADSDPSSEMCKKATQNPECPKEVKDIAKLPANCGKLLPGEDSLFAICLDTNELMNAYTDCEEDFCAFFDDEVERKRMICNAFKATADQCQSKAFTIKWRSDDFCMETCPPNQIHKSNAPGCPPTCKNPSGKKRCRHANYDGCTCKDGFVLSGTHCVPIDQCGCEKDGKYYPLNEYSVSSDCKEVRKCTKNNNKHEMVLVEKRLPCHREFGICADQENGMKKCVCQTGMIGDGITDCQEKCSSSVRKSKSVQCSSWEHKDMKCDVDDARAIVDISLEKQESKSSCTKGVSFKIKHNKLHVLKGCRGIFKVHYIPEDACKKECGFNAEPRKDGRCRCKRGYTGNPYYKCSRKCQCRVSGDPHVRTFDGAMIHYMGICKYIFARSTRRGDPCEFSVEAKLERRHGKRKVSYVQYVEVNIFHLKIRLMKKGILQVNEHRMSMPQSLNGGGVSVYRVGRYTRLTTKCGLSVLWDNNHMFVVDVPDRYKRKLTGICGSCNGNRRDDDTTRFGEYVGKKGNEKYSLIGDSYATFDDSPDPVTRCPKTPVFPSCKSDQMEEVKKLCDILHNRKDSPLKECMSKMEDDAESFYESCVIDVCNTMGATDKTAKQAACDLIESFALSCTENGYDLILWKRPSFCETPSQTDCAANATWKIDASGCPPTCLNPDAPTYCSESSLPACECDAGFVTDNNRCIKPEMCGCSVQEEEEEIYSSVGEESLTDDCRVLRKCEYDTELRKSVMKKYTQDSCGSPRECSLRNGVRMCSCPDADAVWDPETKTCKSGVTSGPVTTSPPSDSKDFTYKGCFKDDTERLLDGLESKNNADMTWEKCFLFCKKHKYFGVEYGKECFCGNTLNKQKYHEVDEIKCKTLCSGNPDQKCGGTWFIKVFKNKQYVTSEPVMTTTPKGPKDFTYKGCFKDDTERLLDGLESKNNADMTWEKCFLFCKKHKYFGVEYGNECFCGNTLNKHKYQEVDEIKCKTPCSGNPDQKCGGTWFIKVFKNKLYVTSEPVMTTPQTVSEDWRYVGCFEDRDDRLLSSLEFKNDETMTIQKCMKLCEGFRYFGVQYAKECFCGEYLDDENYDKVEERKCDKTCAGNTDQTCGGTWHMSVYRSTKDWKYVGCFEDRDDRLLSSLEFKNDETMTIEKCMKLCEGFRYFGVQYAKECFCGDDLDDEKYEKVEERKCDKNCAGNTDQTCGGTWHMSVYRSTKDRCSSSVRKSKSVECNSWDYRDTKCDVGDALTLVDISLDKKESKSACTKGVSFRIKDNKVNVLKGCRGKFTVHYIKKGACKKECGENAELRKNGRCKCKRGYKGNPDYKCSRKCQCRASGDPHFRTFDGNMIHFMGICKYIIARSKIPDDPCGFSVEAKLERRNGKTTVSYVQYVEVKMLNMEVRLMKNGIIEVNGQKVSMPQNFHDDGIYVYKVGRYTRLTSKCGLSVLWDNRHLFVVDVPDRYKTKVMGICGSCNGKKADDFTTRLGKYVGDEGKEKHSLVGDSYVVEDDSPDSVSTCPKTPVFPSCKSDQMEEVKTLCDILHNHKDSPLKECLSRMEDDAKSFYESCAVDVCNTMGATDKTAKQAACDLIESFASDCNENGYDLTLWKRPSFCDMPSQEDCVPNATFKLKASGCPATCLKPDASENCSESSLPACECDAGFVRDGNICIKPEMCGCAQEGEGMYLKINEEYLSEDCRTLQKCESHNNIVTSPQSDCSYPRTCGLRDGVRQCACRDSGSKWDSEKNVCVPEPSPPESPKNETELLSDWRYVGCFEDRDDRLLSSFEFKNDKTMTIQKCMKLCEGFRYFGVQYAKECFCGEYLDDENYDKVEERKCDKTCAGNTDQTCGGTWHMSVYRSTKDWRYVGCFEDRDDRLLSSLEFKNDKTMTIEKCMKLCEGFRYFGVQYAKECFCGDDLDDENYDKVEERKCDKNCAGNTDQTCGGTWHMSVYRSTKDRCSSSVRKSKSVECSSWNNVDTNCDVGDAFTLLDISLDKKESKSACTKGVSFRIKDNKVNVLKGCRGKFTVHYIKKGACKKECGENAELRKNGRCKCKRGYKGNPDYKCSRKCQCRASGDPHFRTFDGNMIHFMGICKYIIARSKIPDDPCGFSVEAKLERRNGKTTVSYVQYVEVKMLNMEVRLMKNGIIEVNGQKVSMPQNFYDDGIYVYKVGRYTRLTSKCGLSVLWDNRHLFVVDVPDRYKKKVMGICGSCNGKKADDFTTRLGKYVGDEGKEKHSLVGDSYVVEDDSPDSVSTCPKTPVFPSCKSDQMEEVKTLCDILHNHKDSPLKECLSRMEDDAKSFYESCAVDVCNTMGATDKTAKQAACDLIESFASDCNENGYELTLWKRPSFCDMPSQEDCVANATFKFKASGCPATCLKPDASENCAESSLPACECDAGFVRDGNICIKPEMCGCAQEGEGMYLKINEEYLSEDCRTLQKCESHNNIVTSPQSDCSYPRTCGLRDGVRQCACHDSGSKWDSETNDCVPVVTECDSLERYNEKASTCPSSCSNLSPNTDCSTKPGCECVEGLVRYNGRCIPVTECLCSITINPDVGPENLMIGEKRNSENCINQYECSQTERAVEITTKYLGPCPDNKICQNGKCECEPGTIKDGSLCIEPPPTESPENETEILSDTTTCSASGSIHYETFDGAYIPFNGECTYELTRFNDPKEKCSFFIHVQNGRTKRAVTTKQVLISFKDLKILLLQDKQVTVNQIRKVIPASVQVNGIDIKIYHSGAFVQVYIKQCNVLVAWTGVDAMTVTLPKVYGDNLSGICGASIGRPDESVDPSQFVVDSSENRNKICTRTLTACHPAALRFAKLVCDSFWKTGKKSQELIDCFKASTDMSKNFYKACIEAGCSYFPPPKDLFSSTCREVMLYAHRCSLMDFNFNWKMELGNIAACKDCSPNPCQNGGTCKELPEGYECSCASGYKGKDCDKEEGEENECSPNPCQNGGTCNDLGHEGHTCSCASGYTGNNCEKGEGNDCSPNPCRNDGSCEPLPGVEGYTCNCAPGYTGPECEEMDNCYPNPCQHEGSCNLLPGLEDYECSCTSNYTGLHCETEINECDPHPCQNGGSCSVLPEGGYTCSCAPGYTDSNCQTDIDECSPNPCEHAGNCIDGVNSFECRCASGYAGSKCETDIDDCSPNACENGGSCIDGVNSYECRCASGYAGRQCETDIDECSPNPCKNGGNCSDGVGVYACQCATGYTGSDCGTDIDECSPNPCQHGGTCSDGVGFYGCDCTSGYTDENCGTDIDECSPNPCKNGGTCSDGVGYYECDCTSGYTGENCGTDIDECSPNPCQNGGNCSDGVGFYACQCATGYTGRDCGTDIDECSPNPCQNGGACADGVGSYACDCTSGYTGENCGTDIDECSPNPCENGGTCIDEVNSYECRCATGYTGTQCQTDIDECSPNPCENGGTCIDEVNSYECRCATGYTGTQCQTVLDACSNDPCYNGGTCESELGSYTCKCATGYIGRDCETDIDECLNNPCQHGGTCKNEAGSYECTCASGYTGTDCDKDINECLNKPCQHGGTCENKEGSYECTCTSGYTGTDCDKDVDECLRNPCENGGTCENKPGSYECMCAPGYTGADCENEIDGCSNDPCKNGGECTSKPGGYDCTCMFGFSGSDCEIENQRCYISGNGGYLNVFTFSRRLLSFEGSCSYNVLQHGEKGDLDYFSIILINERSGPSSSRYFVTTQAQIFMYGTNITLQGSADGAQEVFVNGISEYLPYYDSMNSLQIMYYGDAVLIFSPALSVIFGSRFNMLVSMPNVYGESIHGLCGNHKQTLPTLVSTYVHEYRIKDENSKSCLTLDRVDFCSRKDRMKGRGKCKILNINNKRSPYYKCIAAFKPYANALLEECIQDYCVNPKTYAVHCRHVRTFHRFCQRHGFPSTWLVKNCRGKCARNMRYVAKASGCQKTCSNPNADKNCRLPSYIGCECKPGFIMTNKQCLRKNYCGCTSPSGRYFMLGSFQISRDCSRKDKCTKAGGRAVLRKVYSGKKCHENAECAIRDGQRQCVCLSNFIGNGYTCAPNFECDVEEKKENCTSIKFIKGVCFYRSESRCKYSAFLFNDGEYYIAKIQTGSRKESLRPGDQEQVIPGCAKFYFNEKFELRVQEKIICNDCPKE